MQRWKTIAPAAETPTPACACGAVMSADWAYCARCGRRAGGRRAARPILTPPAVGLAALTLVVGVLVGSQRAARQPSPSAAADHVGPLRAKLTDAERVVNRLQDRNDVLRKRLMDRHDEVARQLAERNDALRKHLKDRNDTVREQLADRDVSIEVLEQRTEAAEQAAEETAALRASLEDAEAQLTAWLASQRAAGQAPPADRAAPGERATPEGGEAFWARFDAEHPNVDGRAAWEESLRAAAEELGPDHPELRDRAGDLFEANLARAEAAGRTVSPP